MDAANDNKAPVPYRENRIGLTLVILASVALWLMQGLWVWRAFGG